VSFYRLFSAQKPKTVKLNVYWLKNPSKSGKIR